MAAVVLRMVKRSNKETIETLRWMLEQAERGRKFDFAGWMRDEDGIELAIFTGAYRADTAQALMAALRMSKHIMLVHDRVYGPPT
jgi:hypothetical protein